MKASPIKRHRAPRYPTKLQAQAQPDLLHRHQPPAWCAVPELTGAVALFLAASSLGCRQDGKPGAAAIVAPVFEHGEGRGSTGCIAISPPVFLSEEEAMQVIREELAQRGVRLTETNRPVAGVKLPKQEWKWHCTLWKIPVPEFLPRLVQKAGVSPWSVFDAQGRYHEDREHGVPLKADGVDPRKRIAVEFVSQSDETELVSGEMSTAQRYDSKAVAQTIAKHVKEEATEKLYFGAFYDPMAPRVFPPVSVAQDEAAWEKRWMDTKLKSAAESKRLLRLQVQDFVTWLQAQGAI